MNNSPNSENSPSCGTNQQDASNAILAAVMKLSNNFENLSGRMDTFDNFIKSQPILGHKSTGTTKESLEKHFPQNIDFRIARNISPYVHVQSETSSETGSSILESTSSLPPQPGLVNLLNDSSDSDKSITEYNSESENLTQNEQSSIVESNSDSILDKPNLVIGNELEWINSNSEYYHLIDTENMSFRSDKFKVKSVFELPIKLKEGNKKARDDWWNASPDKIMKTLQSDDEKVIQFMEYFSHISSRLFDVLGDLFPYNLPNKIKTQVSSKFQDEYLGLQPFWEKYRKDNDLATRLPNGKSKGHANDITIEDLLRSQLHNKFDSRATDLRIHGEWPKYLSQKRPRSDSSTSTPAGIEEPPETLALPLSPVKQRTRKRMYNVPKHWDYEQMKPILVEKRKEDKAKKAAKRVKKNKND